jgi:transcriptional regulator with XRE-family HTH domain
MRQLRYGSKSSSKRSENVRPVAELAKDIGVDRGTIYRWIEGKPLGALGQTRLAAYLGCSEDQLVQYLAGQVDLHILVGQQSSPPTAPLDGSVTALMQILQKLPDLDWIDALTLLSALSEHLNQLAHLYQVEVESGSDDKV